MKAVVQRCFSASVSVDGAVSGSIDKGFLVLLGVGEEDTKQAAEIMANKIAALRVFTDQNDKMNLSLKDVDGKVLAVSNFTLCADTKKGNRPSFSKAMAPDEALRLYNLFCNKLTEQGMVVEKGVFGADMKISMEGDGPVTIILDTEVWMK